jgi:CheY-like chemotaxis protein
VLIIDDDPLVGRAIARLLGHDHDTILVASGPEALELLGPRDWFDVVLCDLQMPGMSGIELHARIKIDFPHVAERMLFFSANCCAPEAVAFARSAGVTVLPKPVGAEELRAAIRAQMKPR